MEKKENNRGVNRSIDNLGRLTLVKEFRDNLKIEEGDEVMQLLVNDTIVVKKVQKSCIICNGGLLKDNAIKIGDKMICNKCMGILMKKECIKIKL